jgi:hypothetical protein
MGKSIRKNVNHWLQLLGRTEPGKGTPVAAGLAEATTRAWETIALRMRRVRLEKRLKCRPFHIKPANERLRAASRYNPTFASVQPVRHESMA